MRTTIITLIAAIAAVALSVPSSFADKAGDRGKLVSRGEDGSVCYELDVKEAEAKLRNMEKLVEAGKLKQAFDAASGSMPGCMPKGGYDRIFSIIERTYKKLGQQAEKSGRIYEAHKYYIYPFERYFMTGSYQDREKQYSFADADRTMLAYAKAKSNDYKVVEEAVRYFDQPFPERKTNLKVVQDLAIRGGDSILAREEKDFAVRKYKAAFDDLNESQRWFGLANDERRAQARAKQRGESLLAESSYDAIERAFDYFNTFYLKTDAAITRANKLGDAAEKKGDLELAEKFYYLSGNEAKKKSIENRLTAIQEQQDRRDEQKEKRRAELERKREQAEPKRQETFKKDQQSLEKELGL